MPQDKQEQKRSGLIPDEVLDSVFDQTLRPGAGRGETPLPSRESEQWPTFDWKEGACSWDGSLTEYRFPEVPPQKALPPVTAAEPERPAPRPEPPQTKAAARSSMTFAESLLAVLVYVAGVLLASFLISP